MNRLNSYELIKIGLLIRCLINVDDNYKVKFIIETINDLKEALTISNLVVSLSGIVNSNNFNDINRSIKKIDSDNKIDTDLANKLIKEMEKIEKIVFSESTIKTVYSLPQRRYNREYLLNTPDKLLNKEVYNKISDMAKFDFNSACRCILYGEGTAVAFHILRATEATLKHYYFHYIKRKRLEKPMWGPMTNKLRDKRTNKPDPNILNSLDNVRISYRNPTQHPEIKYDIDSAQDLFGLCVDLINKMTIAQN